MMVCHNTNIMIRVCILVKLDDLAKLKIKIQRKPDRSRNKKKKKRGCGYVQRMPLNS